MTRPITEVSFMPIDKPILPLLYVRTVLPTAVCCPEARDADERSMTSTNCRLHDCIPVTPGTRVRVRVRVHFEIQFFFFFCPTRWQIFIEETTGWVHIRVPQVACQGLTSSCEKSWYSSPWCWRYSSTNPGGSSSMSAMASCDTSMASCGEAAQAAAATPGALAQAAALTRFREPVITAVSSRKAGTAAVGTAPMWC